MSKYDDKYEAAGEEASQSHVRGIIQQLNEEKPSKEKSREVVVRPDGTKVVRVTKKRRVMVSESDKKKAGRRSFMMILLGAFLLSFVGVCTLLFRMSQMSGEAYVQEQAVALKQAWGAESVTAVGEGVRGTSFHLSGLVAEFPESSLIQRIELTDISAELDTTTFFAHILTGDKMTIARAEVTLNPKARQLDLARYQGSELWRFRRVECENFHASMGKSLSVSDANAYLYYPRPDDKTACAFAFNGGVLQMKGMQPIRVKESKFLISLQGVEEFSLTGTTDRKSDLPGQTNTSLTISGRIPLAASLEGPFDFDSDSMPFSTFTQNRFGRILSAKTLPQAVGRERSRARIVLPLDHEAPIYSGEFYLKDITVTGFPAQLLLTSHLESMKRGNYEPAVISRGRVLLNCEGENISVEFPEEQVVERDLMSLVGRISLNADNALDGELSFGVPSILTHAEYADGKADPIFAESAGMAWLKVTLSGSVNVPSDNSALLNAEAEEARASRPGRLNLDDSDFSKVANQINRDRATLEAVDKGEPVPETPAASDRVDDAMKQQPQQSNEDIFGVPTSRGLDMSSPLDDHKGIFD